MRDYDEAIAYFVGRLGFRLVADAPVADGKRWVLVEPPGAAPGAAALLLARAVGAPATTRQWRTVVRLAERFA